MKKIPALVLILSLLVMLAGCFSSNAATTNSQSTTQAVTQPASKTTTVTTSTQSTTSSSGDNSVNFSKADLDSSTSSPDISYIKLAGNSITISGKGATINGNSITITSAGLYSISGTLSDGQIIVDTQDQTVVKLVLNGVDITCSTSSPIYIVNADKVVITLANGTENKITDGDSYVLEDTASGEPNAAIFSKSDLTINGDGSLIVQANYNNGIQSKDDLKIVNGKITVTSVNDGIKGRDSVVIQDGTITINSGADGLQSNNDVDAAKGFITILGGDLNITAGLDGIQAENTLSVSDGDITITSGSGSTNSSSNTGSAGNTWGNWGQSNNTNPDAASAKGLKAAIAVNITGGTLKIDSSDDSLHSNGRITISGANLTLTSGDDGIHADSAIDIDGGEININKSYEGIESQVITLNNGNIHLISSDDGINGSGGMDGSSVNGRPGQNQFTNSSSSHLYINGGYIYADANGDGIDINGSVDMTGGTVIINGPTNNANGALDHTGFRITGGYLLAVGSAGMALAPDNTSTQYSIIHNFSSTLSAGTLIHIETTEGKNILTFAPTKTYQSVVLSSPDLQKDSTYVIYSGGKSTATAEDGLYSGGVYTGGTKIISFTISSIVTSSGNSGGGFPGGGGRVR
jgi:hypothetical protein